MSHNERSSIPACRSCVSRLKNSISKSKAIEGKCWFCNRKGVDVIRNKMMKSICVSCANGVVNGPLPNHFDSLPDEVMAHMWTFLGAKTTLMARSVCRRFNAMGDDEHRWTMEKREIYSDKRFFLTAQRECMRDRYLAVYREGCVLINCMNEQAWVHPNDTLGIVSNYYSFKNEAYGFGIDINGSIIRGNECEIMRLRDIVDDISDITFYLKGNTFVTKGKPFQQWKVYSPICMILDHRMDYSSLAVNVSAGYCDVCNRAMLMYDTRYSEIRHPAGTRRPVNITGEITKSGGYHQTTYCRVMVHNPMVAPKIWMKQLVLEELRRDGQELKFHFVVERANVDELTLMFLAQDDDVFVYLYHN
jgi:hypothetical protein